MHSNDPPMNALGADPGAPDPLALDARRVLAPRRDEAMFLIDTQGRIASWNEGVEAILGWPAEAWVGQPLHVAFTAEDVRLGVPQAEMDLAARTGRADDKRWMLRRDGEQFFALGSMTRLCDDQGRLVGFLKAVRDFTAPRQVEAECARLLLDARHARAWAENQSASLTAAVEAIPDGVLMGGATGLHRGNAAALQLLGLASLQQLQADPAELIARLRLRAGRDDALLAPDEHPFVLPRDGRTQVRELWSTRVSDGVDVLLRCAVAPICIDGGTVGMVAVLSDLTQRLRLQQQSEDLDHTQTTLQERDAALQAMVQGVRDYAIFTLDRTGRIVGWYRGAELMTGYSAADAVGQPFTLLFTPEDRERGLADTALAMAQSQGEFKAEGLRQRKDGSHFEAAVVLTALRDERGELRGFIKLTQNISERRRVEREREAMLQAAQAARAEAERLSQSKGRFLATISHELRTPLSAILGWAQVLERGLADPETVQQGLGAIARNARAQVQLIDDLLDMNRIELGDLRLDLQRIEFGALLAAAIDAALPAATAKGVALHTAFGADAASMMGDSARLLQVVRNLLSNAIRFTPAGGQVSVRLSCADGQAQVEVADSGQGIELQFLSRIFHRFQQQDATITRRHGGLGVGLAIARHLVELHGGTVHADSPGLDLGATFTVRLPCAPAQAAVGAAVSLAAAPARLDGVTVLLVDDCADLRAVTAQLLEDAGATVVPAGGALEALRVLDTERPDVLLSDIGMPGVDGYELMRRVRRLPPAQGGAIPAAAFTAYARNNDVAEAMAAGYQVHLAKPVSAVALIAAVASLVAARARADHLRNPSVPGTVPGTVPTP